MSVCQHCGADAVGAGGVCAVCGWRASARSSMNESDPQATRADDPAATRADGSSRAPGGLRAGGSGLFAYAPRSNGPANSPRIRLGGSALRLPLPPAHATAGPAARASSQGRPFAASAAHRSQRVVSLVQG